MTDQDPAPQTAPDGGSGAPEGTGGATPQTEPARASETPSSDSEKRPGWAEELDRRVTALEGAKDREQETPPAEPPQEPSPRPKPWHRR